MSSNLRPPESHQLEQYSTGGLFASGALALNAAKENEPLGLKRVVPNLQANGEVAKLVLCIGHAVQVALAGVQQVQPQQEPDSSRDQHKPDKYLHIFVSNIKATMHRL